MAIQWPNTSELRMLDLYLAVSSTDNWALRLYRNNYTPVAGSAFANFTEANFNGYMPAGMNIGWAASTTDGAGKASSQYNAALTFACTGGATQTIYGWYITDGNNRLIMAERFAAPGPYDMVNNGDLITIRPTVKLSDPLT